MNVDKFGHHVFKRKKMDNHYLEPPCITLRDDGCLDAGKKVIKHIGKPTDPEDCVSKQYVDQTVESFSTKLKSISQALIQLDTEINTLKQALNSVSQKAKKK